MAEFALTASALKLELAQLEQMLREDARDAAVESRQAQTARQRRGPSGDQRPASPLWAEKVGGVRGPSHSHGSARRRTRSRQHP